MIYYFFVGVCVVFSIDEVAFDTRPIIKRVSYVMHCYTKCLFGKLLFPCVCVEGVIMGKFGFQWRTYDK